MKPLPVFRTVSFCTDLNGRIFQFTDGGDISTQHSEFSSLPLCNEPAGLPGAGSIPIYEIHNDLRQRKTYEKGVLPWLRKYLLLLVLGELA